MNKQFIDICYEIISHYYNFPDVNDTLKSISDGINHLNSYPQNDFDFNFKKNDIIRYILKVRGENIIYQCEESKKLFVPITPGLSSKTLYDDNRLELYIQLKNEIPFLVLKGVHQVIKHVCPSTSDNALSMELLQQNEITLQKYGLAAGGQS